MKTDILDTPVNATETEAEASEATNAAFRLLADSELMLIGGGGDVVVFP